MREVKRTREVHGEAVLKGLAAGLIGGLVASWTMNEFQVLWGKLAEGVEEMQDGGKKGKKKKSKEGGEEGDDATVKTAEAISENVFDHKLTKSEKKIAGPAVHYAMGATSGAVYGAVAEVLPSSTAGMGLPFGTAVWLLADEAALPALGLSKAPTAYPLSTHAYALASHFVYGLTTELVRRAVRRAI
ncbi:MAG: DUF1440 domain-containing protein [Pyrinomonadaceae bacterium]